MNDPFDRLEQELKSLALRRPSSAVRQAVATRLRPRRRRAWPVLALAALAASVAVAVFLARPPARAPELADRDPVPVRVAPDDPTIADVPISEPPTPNATPAGPPAPTLWAFRRAAGESPEAFDLLLARRDAEQPPVDLPRLSAPGHAGAGGLL